MTVETMQGEITFIHHEKHYCTIEYEHNGKKKSITGNIGEEEQKKLIEQKIIQRVHHFHVGDEVSFVVTLAPRGDKMIADCIQYLFNNALGNLINRATTENRFVGYLKLVDDAFYVKETGSYLFFPLKLSPWEIKPSINKLNEPIFFKLNNLSNPEKLTASMYKSFYIAEYQKALDAFNRKTPVDARIFNLTPYGIHVELFNNRIQGKIPVKGETDPLVSSLKIGDTIKVKITHLSPEKIILEIV